MQEWRDGTPPVPADPDYSDYANALESIQDAVYERCTVAHLAQYPNYVTTTCAAASYSATMPIWRRSEVGLEPDCTITIPEEAAGTTGTMLNPGREIVCTSQGQCSISVAYLEEVTENLGIAASESAYGVFVPAMSGAPAGLQLLQVATSDVTYRLGFRTNDRLLTVNGLPVTTQAQVEAALLSLWSTSSFTVTLRRGTLTRTHVYSIN